MAKTRRPFSYSEYENETGISGNGQKAVQEFRDSYNKVMDEVVRTTMQRLVNSSMEPDQDTDHYYFMKTLAPSKLKNMTESVSDRRSKDICVQGVTSEDIDIKPMMHRDSTVDFEQMQSAMRHLYLDGLSRKSGTKVEVSGRGITVSAEKSACYNCDKQGHYAS